MLRKAAAYGIQIFKISKLNEQISGFPAAWISICQSKKGGRGALVLIDKEQDVNKQRRTNIYIYFFDIF
jgi:hypothetical protein